MAWQEVKIDLSPQALTKKGQFIRKAQQELAHWKDKLMRLQSTSTKHNTLLDQDLPQKVKQANHSKGISRS